MTSPSSRSILRMILDVDLQSIMKEEDPLFSLQFEQMNSSSSVPYMTSAMAEVEPSFMTNEERALVLYKPRESPLSILTSPPNVSVLVRSGLIDGLKQEKYRNRVEERTAYLSKTPVNSTSRVTPITIGKKSVTDNKAPMHLSVQNPNKKGQFDTNGGFIYQQNSSFTDTFYNLPMPSSIFEKNAFGNYDGNPFSSQNIIWEIYPQHLQVEKPIESSLPDTTNFVEEWPGLDAFLGSKSN